MADSERASFVFVVSFLIIFTGFLAAMPVDLQGHDESPVALLPIDPALLTDFASTAEFDKTDFSGVTLLTYAYDLGGYHWLAAFSVATTEFAIERKVLWGGLIWFGAIENTAFFLPNGTSRGETVDFNQIDADATDGAVRYNLKFTDNGNDAGGFIFYWNTTAYASSLNAWSNNKLYLVHGMGISSASATNIFALLLGLMFFQVPGIPTIVNLFIATFIWVSIAFLFWYVIKETLNLL